MARILVFDCDQRRLWEYARALHEHHVTGGTSMADAINRCRRTTVDLIIADWFRADGPELIHHIRSLREPITTPVYLIDRSKRPHDPLQLVRRAIELGAAGLISCLTLPQFREQVNAILAQLTVSPSSVVTPPTPAATTVRTPVRNTPRSDKLAYDLVDTPVVRMARQVGGVLKLNRIMDRHRIRANRGWSERFTTTLYEWAIMDPFVRYIAVAYAAKDLRRKPDDPVNAALIEVADAIVKSMTLPS